MSLWVVANLRAWDGMSDELRSVLQGLVEPTRAEAKCLRYDLQTSANDPHHFTFVEEWAERAALDAHLAAPHIRDAQEPLGRLLDGDIDVQTFWPVA